VVPAEAPDASAASGGPCRALAPACGCFPAFFLKDDILESFFVVAGVEIRSSFVVVFIWW
jgi:hypothetical protein